MKAVVDRGPRNVQVEDVPDSKIETPLDAVIRITTTNICGSDLHMYEGRTGVEEGKIFGHENMGVVEEVGAGVERIKVGDRVSVPFNVACGTCRHCNEGWTSFCQRANPDAEMNGAAYGYAMMGPYAGGQAEYLRVPWADFNLLTLPEGNENESDFTMLSDIFPTAYHGCEMAGVGPGDTVAVFGAGPVGLLAAHSAFIRGASRVFVVDKQQDRLKLAETIGADAIDFSNGDASEQIIDANDGWVDRGIEAVGYQAHDHSGEEHPEMVLDNLVKTVQFTGGIGVLGVYVPSDPDAPNDQAAEGRIGFDYGTMFTKGHQIGHGQAPVKRYNRQLRDLITAGRANPSFIVSHVENLSDAAENYEKFDNRDDGYTKVLLQPQG